MFIIILYEKYEYNMWLILQCIETYISSWTTDFHKHYNIEIQCYFMNKIKNS